MTRWALIAALAFAMTGCGLIDPDITNFDLQIKPRQFTVDTAQWGLTADATFPAIDCTGAMSGVCSAGISQACASDLCFGSCDGTNCTAKILISLFHTIDLNADNPELETIAQQPVIDVVIDRVAYDVTENTLSMASPVMTLYVAPATVVSPGDPQAKAIGEIPPIPSMDRPTDVEVNLTPEGKMLLRQFMNDYRTSFNFLVGAQVDMYAGDVLPLGRVQATVRVAAHAGVN